VAEREIKVKWTGDEKDFERAAKAAEKAVRGVEDTAEKSAGKLSKFGAAGAGFLAGFAGSQLVDFGKGLYNTGKRLDSMQKKAGIVFGDSLPMIEEWSKTTAGSFGVTRTELTGMATNFADLLKPMGFTSSEAAQMSQRALGLAGALSVWSNGTRSTAEVSEILTAAMLGEREQLKGLGVSISAADVEQRLFERGQKDLTGAAREQAEAMATLDLVFEKSTDAQDFWNSSGADNAKTQNEVNAKLKEAYEQLALKLYPIMADFIKWLAEKGIPKIGEIATKVGEWWEKQDDLRDVLQGLVDMGGKLGGWFLTFFGWVDTAVEKTKDFARWLDTVQEKLGLESDKFNDFKDRAREIGADQAAQGYDPNNPDAYIGPVARRANGGPVSMNMPYMVGERGPELFVPSGNGTIVPNDELGSSTVVNVNLSLLDGSQVTPQLARKLGDAIRRELAAVA
jgi:hypothetical protein